jgi:hypothetical protein
MRLLASSSPCACPNRFTAAAAAGSIPVVIHQDQGVDLHLETIVQLGHAPKKPPAIGVGSNDGFTVVSSIHNMMPATCHNHPKLPRHGEMLPKRLVNIQCRDLTPWKLRTWKSSIVNWSGHRLGADCTGAMSSRPWVAAWH